MKFNFKITALVLIYIALVLIAPCESMQKRTKKYLKHSTGVVENNVLSAQNTLASDLEAFDDQNKTVSANNTNVTNATNGSNSSNVSKPAAQESKPVAVNATVAAPAPANKSANTSAPVSVPANVSENKTAPAASNVTANKSSNASSNSSNQSAVKAADPQQTQDAVKAIVVAAAAQVTAEIQAKAVAAEAAAVAQQKLEEANKTAQIKAAENKTVEKVVEKKSSTINIPNKKVLPTTPKALELSNHYGSDPKLSPYGPQPILLKQDAWINSSNGTIQKTVITKVIQTSQDESGCDISSFDHFQLCLEFTDCDLCAAAPQCGWCSITNRCLPGTVKQAGCASACPAVGWNFNATACRKNVKSGYIRMAKEATKIVHPELTQPKAKLDTVITHQAVVKTPVLLGTKKYRTQTTEVDTNGNVVGKHDIDIVKPIVGEIHQVMNVDTHHQQYVDIKSGKRLDKQEVDSFHGTENY